VTGGAPCILSFYALSLQSLEPIFHTGADGIDMVRADTASDGRDAPLLTIKKRTDRMTVRLDLYQPATNRQRRQVIGLNLCRMRYASLSNVVPRRLHVVPFETGAGCDRSQYCCQIVVMGPDERYPGKRWYFWRLRIERGVRPRATEENAELVRSQSLETRLIRLAVDLNQPSLLR